MLLVTSEFYMFSKSRLSRDLHLERLEVAASFQTHGHLCFMTFACVLPGTCFPPKASSTKLYSRLMPRLKVTCQTGFSLPTPKLNYALLPNSFMVSCPFSDQTLSLIVCVSVCRYTARSSLTTVFPLPPRAGTQKG